MSLVRTLNDVRKMRRSIKMRGESDPEVVATTLESILREAITLQAADANGKLGKGATDELRNIRSDLVAKQVDAGKRTPELIGKFSLILDEMDDIENKAKEASKGSSVSEKGAEGLKNTFSSITSAIPSAETITSALITANPILGYGSKMIVDLVRTKKEQKKHYQEERQTRLQQLKEREALLERQLETADDEAKKLEEGDECNLDCSSNETLEMLLTEVRDEIKQLNAVWSDDPDSSAEKQTQSLETIVEETKKSNRLEQLRLREQEIDERTAALEGRGDSDRLIQMGEEEGGGFNVNAMGLGGLAGRAGAIGGMIAGSVGAFLTKVLTPFIGIITFFKKGAKFLGRMAKFAGKATLITALFMGIFDFVNSFINAGSIIGKMTEDIDIGERITAGFAGLIHGLLSPIDWILDFFNMGFLEENKEESIKQIFDVLNGWRLKAVDWMVGLFEGIDTFFTEMIPEMFTNIKNGISITFDGFVNNITDFVSDALDWINDLFWGTIGKIGEKIGGWVGSTVDFFTGTGETIGEEIERGATAVSETAVRMLDTGREGVNYVTDNLSGLFDDGMVTVDGPLVTADQWEQVGLSSSALERATQRIEQSDIRTMNENNVSISPVNSVTNNNVRNTTVRPNVGSSSNTDPTLERLRRQQQ